MSSLTFLGAAGTVTGSKHLLDLELQDHFVPAAARIEQIDSMSAHADAGEITRWLSGFSRPPAMTYLVHGEPAALDALKTRIGSTLRWPVHVAEYLERVDLDLR